MNINSNTIQDLLGLEDISEQDSDEDLEETWSISSLRDRVLDSIEGLDYLIRLDRNKSMIELRTRDGEIIGVIGKGTFERGLVYKKCHLYKRIEEKFRGQGYGTALMQEYIDAGLELPDYEVTGVFETYILLLKFGYIFSTILNPKNGNEILSDTIPSDEQIRDIIQKGYIVKLEKCE